MDIVNLPISEVFIIFQKHIDRVVFIFIFLLGLQSFLMYSVNEGIRGLSLDPSDNSEVLMLLTGTLFAVGLDYHAGKCTFPLIIKESNPIAKIHIFFINYSYLLFYIISSYF